VAALLADPERVARDVDHNHDVARARDLLTDAPVQGADAALGPFEVRWIDAPFA
jgi:hypothetical protein